MTKVERLSDSVVRWRFTSADEGEPIHVHGRAVTVQVLVAEDGSAGSGVSVGVALHPDLDAAVFAPAKNSDGLQATGLSVGVRTIQTAAEWARPVAGAGARGVNVLLLLR
jgi:hypothetical protein